MPRGVTKRRPETTARLLSAAMEVFAERGFYGASIEDICERAGFTRGAFYSNFRTKDELFLALFDAHGEQLMARLGAAVEAAGPHSGELEPFIEHLVDAAAPNDRAWYLLTTEFTLYAIRNPEAARLLAEHDGRLRAQLVALLGTQFAMAGQRSVVDLDELARLLIAVVEGAGAQCHVEPDRLPPGRLERTFFPVIIRAVTRPASSDSKS